MKFKYPGNLSKHLNRHKSMKHACKFQGCNAIFYSLEYLKYHKKAKGHLTSEEKLEIDQKSSDDDQNVISNLKSLKCLRCLKLFRYKLCYIRHIKDKNCTVKKINSFIQSKNQDQREKLKNSQKLVKNAQKLLRQNKNSLDRHFCFLCDSSYSIKRNLTTHLRVKHNILTKKNKRMHVQLLFSPDRKFKCSQCDIRSNSMEELKSHEKRHKFYKFNCDLCENNYPKIEILKEHKQRAHFYSDEKTIQAKINFPTLKDCKNNVKQFSCPKCKISYDKRGSLSHHIRIKHKNFYLKNAMPGISAMFSLDRKYACNLCDLKFLVQSTLQDHLKSHENFKFQCKHCGNKYWIKKILNEHMKIAHKVKIDNFNWKKCSKKYQKNLHKCDQCKKNFSTKKYLHHHMKFYHKIVLPFHMDISKMFSNDRPFKCSQCDLRFSQANGLRCHELSHDTFEFKCEIENCGKKYWKKEILVEHQRRFHKQNKNHDDQKLRFQCSECDENYKRKQNLNIHMKKKHNIELPKSQKLDISLFFSSKRPYKCYKCDMRFDNLKSRKNHLDSHKSFKFKCFIDGCGMNYWREDILWEHQKRFHFKIPQNDEIDVQGNFRRKLFFKIQIELKNFI